MSLWSKIGAKLLEEVFNERFEKIESRLTELEKENYLLKQYQEDHKEAIKELTRDIKNYNISYCRMEATINTVLLFTKDDIKRLGL